MRRTIVMFAVLAMLGGVLALPAMAANVSANCGTGGYFYTYGTADDWQDHVHDSTLWHVWYYGRQYQSHNWGWEAGTEYGTVDGPNLSSPGARCVL